MVHRDIKPENIFFDQIPVSGHRDEEGIFMPGLGGGGIGRVVIGDFGLSKRLGSAEPTSPCGTVGYMAPEIARDGRYGKAVDMWALGCVFFSLVTGLMAFGDGVIHEPSTEDNLFDDPCWENINPSGMVAEVLAAPIVTLMSSSQGLHSSSATETSSSPMHERRIPRPPMGDKLCQEGAPKAQLLRGG